MVVSIRSEEGRVGFDVGGWLSEGDGATTLAAPVQAAIQADFERADDAPTLF